MPFRYWPAFPVRGYADRLAQFLSTQGMSTSGGFCATCWEKISSRENFPRVSWNSSAEWLKTSVTTNAVIPFNSDRTNDRLSVNINKIATLRNARGGNLLMFSEQPWTVKNSGLRASPFIPDRMKGTSDTAMSATTSGSLHRV